MAEDKSSFIGYVDWGDTFEMLDDVEAGKLIKHFFKYIKDENPELTDKILQIAFQPIKLQLKRDLVKWVEIKVKRSNAGRASANKRQQESTNPTHVESVEQESTNPTVTVNVNDNVNGSVINIKEPKGSYKASPSKIDIFKLNTNQQVKDWMEFYDSLPAVSNTQEMAQRRQELKGWIEIYEPTIIEPFATAWNLFAEKTKVLSQVESLSDSRKKKFNTRIRDPEFKFYLILSKIQASEHLKGGNDRGWKVTWDWIFENDSNFRKIQEDNYR